jgi:hypothetical protein
MGRNLGGRAYLVAELVKRGASRRRAVAIVNKVFEEMGLALRRGEYVEFPFGYLKARKRLSKRWEAIGDEPMRPWTVEHFPDDDGERVLEGEVFPRAKPGWSRKPDKHSIIYLWDRSLRRESKKAAAPPRAGPRRRVANK